MLWTKKKDRKAGTTLIGICYGGKTALGTDFNPEKPDGDEIGVVKKTANALIGFTGKADAAVVHDKLFEKVENCSDFEKHAHEVAELWKNDENLAELGGNLVLFSQSCAYLITPGEAKQIPGGIIAVGPGKDYALAAIRAILAQPEVKESTEQVVKKAFTVAAGVCVMVNPGSTIICLE
jgi:ATP-dependent protease HslVU (ClpYQ) peptidase subunit